MPLYRIHDRNVLFLHVPKTGGSSVERWLANHARPSMMRAHRDGLLPAPAQHLHAAALAQLFDPSFIDYAFCIIRHPVHRLQSEFVWRMTGKKIRRFMGLHRTPFADATPEQRAQAFSPWFDKALTRRARDPWYLSNHLRPQVEFTEWPGIEVFRFENGIDGILRRIADRVGLPAPAVAPHEKSSRSQTLEIGASDRARIARVYARDFEEFGYDPED
ncbi:sulfotransferase family 2 domain-containing protein [Marivita sp. GX14005]|uniref:sulfotransferase family 2 domain-containing protein n=1 Tax=Marivita sp. GX14005 TaxID=2942276 RepID=UPI00201884F5|nr:sulfotransferase family protein [Marivita sp. GX14005]